MVSGAHEGEGLLSGLGYQNSPYSRLRLRLGGSGSGSSAYVHALMIVNLAVGGKNMGVAHSVPHIDFDRAVKGFMLACPIPVGIGGLSTKEKRDELEELNWAGLQETIRSRRCAHTLLQRPNLTVRFTTLAP